MKFTSAAVTAAALAGAASAAREKGTFAVMQFNGKEIMKGRLDPIVSPGNISQHVHSFMGGSAASADATGETMAKSKCTNAKVLEDNSLYWAPAVYFHDEDAGTFEPVELFYVNAYYFFEATDDDLVAFPTGLQMVAGDPSLRTSPGTGKVNLNPDDGKVQPIQWTCPRGDSSTSAWPANSDGSKAGLGNPDNTGVGTGFPDTDCDGYASPLRADIHFPSCYNPEEGLTAYKTNTAYPTIKNGKQNCPKGWIHVPHVFLEYYWDTHKFADRWTQRSGKQPFVMSSGDATGFSSHGDILAAWDEEALQQVIDSNCDAGHGGLHTCSGVTENTNQNCKAEFEPPSDEKISGTLSQLPGGNALQGWFYGVADKVEEVIDNVGDAIDDVLPGSSDDEEEEEEVEGDSLDYQNNAAEDDSSAVAPIFKEKPSSPPSPVATEPPSPRVKTVWETVLVTATATAVYGQEDSKVRRHVHDHAMHHRSPRHHH